MLTLLVEDDPDYAEIIAHTLKRDQHDVVTIDNVAGASSFLAKKLPDLAVLDVMLPDGSGLQLCEALRSHHPTLPVVMLTSLDRLSDVLAGFKAGANDYIVKPFHPAELLARVNAVLRGADRGCARPQVASQRIECNGLEVDVANHSAFLDGISLNCTPIEVDILGQLARYPGQALSHAFLTEQVWGYKNVRDASLLKGHMSSIRRKIKLAGGDEDILRTVHGVGYSFTPI
ncbi:MAG TPA: response regulator transcription factor [Gemmatimonadales bacterium]|nr:response regulator transcription factor [Gemmatimonadales bacterium]